MAGEGRISADEGNDLPVNICSCPEARTGPGAEANVGPGLPPYTCTSGA